MSGAACGHLHLLYCYSSDVLAPPSPPKKTWCPRQLPGWPASYSGPILGRDAVLNGKQLRYLSIGTTPFSSKFESSASQGEF